MRLGKAEAREAAHLLEHPLGQLALDAALDRAGDEALAVGVQRRLRARRLIARRRPSASPAVNPAIAIATWITWSWKTIAPSVSARIGSRVGCS